MDIIKGLFKEFGWFIWALVGIGVIWFFNGGTERFDSHEPYIKPAAPIDSGETYGKPYLIEDKAKDKTLDLPEEPAIALRNTEELIKDFLTQSKEAKKIHDSALLTKTLLIDGPAGMKANIADQEYVRLLAPQNSTKSTLITGLTLTGAAYGVKFILPQAANLPIVGSAYKKTDIVMPSDGRALISSGKSPIGTSFRANICTGYLGQFQDFTPDLRNECPSASDELKAAGLSGDAACAAFVKQIPKCRTYEGALPANLSASCRIFVTGELNYNSCSVRHQGDKGFFKDEWRIYLEQSKEVWNNRQEIIRLLDGKTTLDAVAY